MPCGFEPVLFDDLPPRAIEPLVQQQIRERRSTLLWDYTRSAQRLLFLTELRAVQGLALVRPDGSMVGYASCAHAGGLVEFSDFYVSPEFRSVEVSTELLRCCLERLLPVAASITLTPELPHPLDLSGLPVTPRLSYTAAEAASVERVCAGLRENKSTAFAIRPWQETDQEPAIEIVPSSYTREMDSAIRQSADAAIGARNFVESIIEVQAHFPFLPEASVTAIDRESGRLAGFLLASQAMEGVAYANFLCVAPWAAGHRLGDRLSVEHCFALRRLGFHTVTLRRRTTDPRLARFYARMGFVKQFDQVSCEWSAA